MLKKIIFVLLTIMLSVSIISWTEPRRTLDPQTIQSLQPNEYYTQLLESRTTIWYIFDYSLTISIVLWFILLVLYFHKNWYSFSFIWKYTTRLLFSWLIIWASLVWDFIIYQQLDPNHRQGDSLAIPIVSTIASIPVFYIIFIIIFGISYSIYKYRKAELPWKLFAKPRWLRILYDIFIVLPIILLTIASIIWWDSLSLVAILFISYFVFNCRWMVYSNIKE